MRGGRALPSYLALLVLLAGCGGAPPKAAGRAANGARVERDLDPTDLFPVDLDLVVRIDIGRMRAGIGPAVADALAKRALQESAEAELREALACAEVVWVATRVAEIDEGDRVVVIEGRSCMPELAEARWQRVGSVNSRLRIFDRADPPPRTGTARIINLGNRASAFVSTVELDAVRRVLEAGPDEKRGSPTAEGLVSLDLRAGRLPPALEKKYPAIGAVLAGVERVRGSVVLVDQGVKIDAQVLGATTAGAERAARFLEAMRDSLAKIPRFAAAAGEVHVEQVARTVQVRLTVPAKAVLAMLAGELPGGADPAASDGKH
jgi:hypothetical protein